MFVKKWLYPVLVLLLIVSMVAVMGCEADEEVVDEPDEEPVEEPDEEPDEEPVESVTISFVAAIPLTGINEIIATDIQENIEEYTDGRIEVDLYFDGVLGGEMDHLEMLVDGEIELALNYLHDTRYAEHLAAHHVPFLFPSFDALYEYLNHPEIAEERGQIFRDNNIEYIDTWGTGPRRITSNQYFTNVEEMEGLRIRMPEIPMWVRIYEELGTDPTPIAAPEIFESLEAGVIDAQENWIANIHGRRMDEVQDYVMDTDHLQMSFCVLANKDFYDDLDPEIREAFVQAIEDACAALPPHVEEENERLMEELQERGMEFVQVDREQMVEVAWPAIESVAEDFLDENAWEIAREIAEEHAE